MNWLLIFFGILMVAFLMIVMTAIVRSSGLEESEMIGLIARLCSVGIASMIVGATSPIDALINGISVGAIGYVPFLIISCIIRPRGARLPLVILAWVIWLPVYILIGAIGGFIGGFLGGKF